MALYLITGNKNKFEEIKAVIPNVQQLDIDLPELQDVDARRIIEQKLSEAVHHHKESFIVEDTSLYLDCLNGFPGPLIKWLEKGVGVEGIWKLAKTLGNTRAQAKTLIGFAKSCDEMYFFEGVVQGSIVAPRGTNDFGWGPIFQPEGCAQTFGEMSREEKQKIGMRGQALVKLQEFLNRVTK